MKKQDSYYRDQVIYPLRKRVKAQNYDHPNAFDAELLVEHLRELSNWNRSENPYMIFELHNRKKKQKISRTYRNYNKSRGKGILVLGRKKRNKRFYGYKKFMWILSRRCKNNKKALFMVYKARRKISLISL